MSGDLPEAEPLGDDRAELLAFVQALRANVEWQSATGSTGLPRDPDAKRRLAQTAAEPSADPSPERAAERPRAGGPPPISAALPVPTASFEPADERPAIRSTARRGSSAASTAATPLPVVRVAEAPSLEALQADVAACKTCGLCEQRKQTVFSRGTGKSGLCFVGEGPGADEDQQGEPFVGAAGQLLDRMIAAMGIERDDVYVANIVKCRPPDNRKPLPEEMAACVPYLHRQLELIAPTVIVALGATALEGLLGKTGGITRHRGRFSLYRGKVAVMPTFHPAYLLRQPSAKRDVWSDLQQVLQHMGRPLKSP